MGLLAPTLDQLHNFTHPKVGNTGLDTSFVKCLTLFEIRFMFLKKITFCSCLMDKGIFFKNKSSFFVEIRPLVVQLTIDFLPSISIK